MLGLYARIPGTPATYGSLPKRPAGALLRHCGIIRGSGRRGTSVTRGGGVGSSLRDGDESPLMADATLQQFLLLMTICCSPRSHRLWMLTETGAGMCGILI